MPSLATAQGTLIGNENTSASFSFAHPKFVKQIGTKILGLITTDIWTNTKLCCGPTLWPKGHIQGSNIEFII